jgi:hypothetical protein
MDKLAYYIIILILVIILFVNINKKEENFSLSDDLLCGVSDENKLWCAWENVIKNPKWNQIKGDVKHISLTENNELYGLDENGNLYFRNDSMQDFKNPINWNIPNVPGQELKSFVKITVHKNMICGIDSDGSIFYYDRTNIIDPSWKKIEPPEDKSFKDIIIQDNKIYAITSENEIYFKEHYNNDEWNLVSNSLQQISADKNLVCGIDMDNVVHCFDNDKILNPNWVKIEGKTLDNILVKNNVIFGVDKNKEIFMTRNYKDEKPIWEKIPGNGLKQIDIIQKKRWF